MTLQIESESTYGIFHDVSWDYYTHTLDEFVGRRDVHIAYDEGTMEIMTSSDSHEFVKKVIARLIETYSLTQDIQIGSRGQTTLRKALARKGLEPDECYYIRTRAPRLTMGALDLSKFPPPDLAVKVEISRGTLAKRPIYAALGVPEIWRFDLSERKVIPMHLRSDGNYEEQDASLNFPNLPLPVMNQVLGQALETEDEHAAIKTWDQFLRGS